LERKEPRTKAIPLTDTKAPAPELASNLKVQQSANRFALIGHPIQSIVRAKQQPIH
jgi:hypothetical protein